MRPKTAQQSAGRDLMLAALAGYFLQTKSTKIAGLKFKQI
jgi:hypothetical protein